jgi:hypothetical protein
MSSSLETPKFHIKSILEDVSLSIDNHLTDNMTGDFSDIYSTPFHDTNFVTDAVDTIVGHDQVSSVVTSKQDFLPIENSMIVLGDIMRMFCPQVLPIETGIASGDIIPQNISSINNVFSSLVCSCLPSYMNNIGLSSVSFAHNSHSNATQVLHIDSMFDDTQEILKVKWQALFTKMRSDLFPILLSNGGHFDITVFANVSDTVDVILNFLDYQLLPEGAMFQENCSLGGITSPLVGTHDYILRNANEVNTLLNNMDISLPGGRNEISVY